MPPRTTTKKDEKLTYLVNTQADGKLKITVPSSWKVTFGPLVPGAKGYGNGASNLSLRFWETKDKQRACFVGVLSFREITKIEVKQALYGKEEREVKDEDHEWEEVEDYGSI